MLQSTTVWLRPVGDTGLGVNVSSKRRLLTIILRLPNSLYEALGVSRSGSYAWRTRPGSERARTDALILVTMRTSFLLSDRTYGARRMVDDVRDAWHVCGRDPRFRR